MSLLNALKKAGKNFHLNELGAELLEKNKELWKASEKSEAETKKIGKLLEEKAVLLYGISRILKTHELELAKKLEELENKQMRYSYLRKLRKEIKSSKKELKALSSKLAEFKEFEKINARLKKELKEKELALIKKEKELKKESNHLQAQKNRLRHFIKKIRKEGNLKNKLVQKDKELRAKSKQLENKDAELKAISSELHAMSKKIELTNKEYHKLMQDKAHKDVLLLVEQAKRHMERENFQDVRNAYDAIRQIYSKLSPEGKRKIHGHIAKLRDDIMGKFYKK